MSYLEGPGLGKSPLSIHNLFCTFPLKGLGNEIVVPVWFDRPWLGESPADFIIFIYCPFYFILN